MVAHYCVQGIKMVQNQVSASYKETLLAAAAAHSELPYEVVLERSPSIKHKWAMSLWRLLYLCHKPKFPMF